MIKRSSIFFFLFLLAINLISQGQTNPFDLPADETENQREEQVGQVNPFDIPQSGTTPQSMQKTDVDKNNQLSKDQREFRGFYMGTAATILVSLAL